MKLDFSAEQIRALRLDPNVQAYVDRIGRDIAEKCGDGYEYRPPSRNLRRDRGAVMPTTVHAKRSNAKHLTLIKVVTAYRA